MCVHMCRIGMCVHMCGIGICVHMYGIGVCVHMYGIGICVHMCGIGMCVHMCGVCGWVLPACIYVYHMCTWYLWRSEKDIRSPGTRIVDSCEPPQWCWELNSNPMQEQVFLTTETSV